MSEGIAGLAACSKCTNLDDAGNLPAFFYGLAGVDGQGFAVCHTSLNPSPLVSPACLSAA
ncbi:hypothetical protein BgramDRAFT_3674 [Paraburkholderia graminis C4D1M]|uniref:Uncharacterized protein n=1 Tax=Paraburkholderia graminis (strain ATCC 700544 / DSM 17151 / LMG 18924 / NCIMB 13744 / C4D1M) TaxID=396598 RepID=B1G2X3_PARG4|nr:hypothetical protein BgramDRAFT_3674 [Paraburkholderia graminis C4D1M]